MLLAALALARLIVSPAGPYRTVAEAIAAAAPGDTIEIRAGHYREGPLVLERPVTIEGVGDPTIEGAGEHTILTIKASDVSVRGLVIRHVLPSGVEDRAAIKLESAARIRVIGNRIEDAYFGIHGGDVRDVEVRDNLVRGPGRSNRESGNAIHFWSSERVTVTDNEVTGHRDGLYLEFVRASRLAGNRSHDNRRYGMHFMFSDSTEYRGNRFERNGVGVAVMYSKRVTMEGNLFVSNVGQAAYGLLLKDINDSRIVDNEFTGNTVGLYLEGSNRQEVRGNRFSGNGWAVRVLANSDHNAFEENSFVGNAFDVATNSRSATSRFGGNFWDQYRGYDLDGDGRGDVPFRPVRLFSLVVERNEPALILLRSIFVSLLDQAERLLPILTPDALTDRAPLMEPPRR
ncbi:MAG: nitrous oxide reductase family maturation protein NosD [Gemmatimonadales bacterium]